MRTAYRVWSGVAAATFVLVAVVDLSTSDKTDTAASAAASSSSSYSQSSSSGPRGASQPSYASGASAGSSPGTAYAGAVAPGGEVVSVTRVIDGDTFEVAGGRRIRVLGIDSCEANTPGGESATQRAQSALPTGTVSLTREPGVDKDPYGRELRYVYSDGLDFGMSMIGYSDTGVYEGRNDASPSYVSQLRAADYGTRECGDNIAPTTEPTPDSDDDRRPYVPDPAPTYSDPEPTYDSDDDSRSRRHTGNTGHPCLPGERDGDDDGYCGEGR